MLGDKKWRNNVGILLNLKHSDDDFTCVDAVKPIVRKHWILKWFSGTDTEKEKKWTHFTSLNCSSHSCALADKL